MYLYYTSYHTVRYMGCGRRLFRPSWESVEDLDDNADALLNKAVSFIETNDSSIVGPSLPFINVRESPVRVKSRRRRMSMNMSERKKSD